MHRILFLEDSSDDIELMEYELASANFEYLARQSCNRDRFLEDVKTFRPHVILADYSLTSEPMFNGMEAFRMLKDNRITIPFVLVTGALSEKLALECLEKGIDDFILKSSLKRLPAAIVNAINKKNTEREKEKMAVELRKSHRELQLLTEQLQNAREQERLRVARDLHDELGQVLSALKIDISMLWKSIMLGKSLTGQSIDREFNEIIRTVDQTMQSVRRIATDLRPGVLDELGIIEAIKWHCHEFEKRTKIVCITTLNELQTSFDRDFSMALFRILQESLTNVARHAMATYVEVQLKMKNHFIELTVSDNGKGITSRELNSSTSLGIIGLRERVRILNGKINFQGLPGKGTTVSVEIPFIQAKHVSKN